MKKTILLLLLFVSIIGNAQKDYLKVDNFQKTDEVLSEVVKKTLTVAEKTGDFVIEQAPLLLQEFYAWHICLNIMRVSLCLIIFILLIILIKNRFEKEKSGDLDFADAECFFPVVLGIMGLIIAVVFLFSAVYDLVFILVAPKLYLIEYFVK